MALLHNQWERYLPRIEDIEVISQVEKAATLLPGTHLIFRIFNSTRSAQQYILQLQHSIYLHNKRTLSSLR